MATPTLRALRQRFPHAQITGLARQVIADTLDGNPWLDETVVVDKLRHRSAGQFWAQIQYLRRNRFDCGILLPNSFGSALLSFLGGVRRRVGYAREWRSGLLTNTLSPARSWSGFTPSPLVDYYLLLAKLLGADTSNRQLELFLRPRDEAHAAHFFSRAKVLPGDSLVVLNPGAAFGPAKQWAAESFAALAQRLVDQAHVKVIVLCGPNERALAQGIVDASERRSSVHSLAHETVSIGLSKAIVARSRLLISTDSGPRHFAAAFGVPVVSLFGPTHIAWTETYFPGEIKLQKSVPCGPCQKRVCPEGHHRCMRELTVDEVFRAALDRLEWSTGAPHPLRVA